MPIDRQYHGPETGFTPRSADVVEQRVDAALQHVKAAFKKRGADMGRLYQALEVFAQRVETDREFAEKFFPYINNPSFIKTVGGR